MKEQESNGFDADVAKVVRRLVSEATGIPQESLSEKSRLSDDLAVESPILIEIQVSLEDYFDLALDPIRLVELDELGAIIRYVAAAHAEQIPR